MTSTIISQVPEAKIGMSNKSEEMKELGNVLGQSLSWGTGHLWGTTKLEREDLARTVLGSCYGGGSLF